MKKDSNQPIALISTAVFLLAMPAMVTAATFSYYASSLFSQSGAKVYNASETVDPGPNSSWSHLHVESYQSAQTSDGSIYANGLGSGDVWLTGKYLSIHIEGGVNGNSNDPSGHMESYGGTSTVAAGVTTGIYFKLDPEIGENIGDPVRIDFAWMGDLGTSSATTAHIDGGFAGDTIAITLNDYPEPVNFDPDKAVWTRTGNSAINGIGDGFWDEDGFFIAAIGDIIGIHMGAGAGLALDGEGQEISAAGSQTLSMTANPVPIPGAVWFLGSGFFVLAAVKRRK